MSRPFNCIPEKNPVIRADVERIAAEPLPWEMLCNKTIMVTGGSGFLAAYLVKSLLAISRFNSLNTRVVCVARNAKSVESRLAQCVGAPDFELCLHDVSQPMPPDMPEANFIIHAASQASPKFYGIDPVGTLLPNSVGTMYLLEHAVKTGADRFLFFSSGEVYGVPTSPEQEVGESDYGYLDPSNVRACYAESKRMGETMCTAWAAQYGLHTSVVRPFHTYGPGMSLDDGRVFADFVADVLAPRDIVLKSDGMALRPFCYIADATIAFLAVLLLGEKAQAYNVGNPNAEMSIRDLAVTIAGLFPDRGVGTKFEVRADSNLYLKSPITRSCPSIEKIGKLNWSPSVGVEEGFRRTILSFLQIYN